MKRTGLQSRCLLVVLLAPIVGCASMPPAVTLSNNHVQMPHYSFVVPPDRGWHIQRFDSLNESAIIGQDAGPLRFEMKLMRNIVSDEALKQATAKTVADDFRELEKRIMIEQGVNLGLYRRPLFRNHAPQCFSAGVLPVCGLQEHPSNLGCAIVVVE